MGSEFPFSSLWNFLSFINWWLMKLSYVSNQQSFFSPLIGHIALSLVIKSLAIESSHLSLCPLSGHNVLSMVIKSSHLLPSPLIGNQSSHWSSCHQVFPSVFKSTHWFSSPLIGHHFIQSSSQLMIFSESVREIFQ